MAGPASSSTAQRLSGRGTCGTTATGCTAGNVVANCCSWAARGSSGSKPPLGAAGASSLADCCRLLPLFGNSAFERVKLLAAMLTPAFSLRRVIAFVCSCVVSVAFCNCCCPRTAAADSNWSATASKAPESGRMAAACERAGISAIAAGGVWPELRVVSRLLALSFRLVASGG